jgi:hypothetical protein
LLGSRARQPALDLVDELEMQLEEAEFHYLVARA